MAKRSFRERFHSLRQSRAGGALGSAGAVAMPAAIGAGLNIGAQMLAGKSEMFKSKWWAEPAMLLGLAVFGPKIPVVNKIITPADRRGLAMLAGYSGKQHYDQSQGKVPWPVSLQVANTAPTTKQLQDMRGLQDAGAFVGSDALNFT